MLIIKIIFLIAFIFNMSTLSSIASNIQTTSTPKSTCFKSHASSNPNPSERFSEDDEKKMFLKYQTQVSKLEDFLKSPIASDNMITSQRAIVKLEQIAIKDQYSDLLKWYLYDHKKERYKSYERLYLEFAAEVILMRCIELFELKGNRFSTYLVASLDMGLASKYYELRTTEVQDRVKTKNQKLLDNIIAHNHGADDRPHDMSKIVVDEGAQSPLNKMIQQEVYQAVLKRLESISPRNREMFFDYISNDKASLQAVGDKFGITKQSVSKVIQKIKRTLKQH